MAEAVKRGEAMPGELAYLTDRVLLAEGKPQEYGTQMTGRKAGWVPRDLRAPETVDERRAAMSLGPLREKIARIARQYGPPNTPATDRDLAAWRSWTWDGHRPMIRSCVDFRRSRDGRWAQRRP
jgi:hypothetical protein